MKLSELFEDSPGKEVLLSGNEAFARGIYESGVVFTSNYPGTPLSEVGDYLHYLSLHSKDFTFDYALNEKVALESCIGASWAGTRSVAMFKHLGLNVAADPLHTFPYSGVNGGMLILCGGDPGILSSTNAQDNRLYSLHTKIPIIEPATVQECKDYIREGLRLSELYKIPIYLHVTTRLCHSYGKVKFGEVQPRNHIGRFEHNPSRYINTLGKALINQKNLFSIIAEIVKARKIFYLLNEVKFPREPAKEFTETYHHVGILTSGICYSYVLQACHKLDINPPILKLGLIFPINREEICRFATEYNLQKLLIVEELEPFIESYSKDIFCNFCDSNREEEIHGKDFLPNIGELDTDIIMEFFAEHFTIKNQTLLDEISTKKDALQKIIPSLPVRQPTFCPGCQYRPVFYELRKVTDDLKKEHNLDWIFSGDIGCYTLAEAYPYEMIDWIVCMGAGLGIANGMAYAIDKNKQKIIAFIGDSTLFHSGLQPLLNAIKNNIDITIFIFNNYWTAMTGHQTHIATPKQFHSEDKKTDLKGINLVKFIESLDLDDLVITDAYNIEKLNRIFKSTLMKSGTKVIIIQEECALEKKRRLNREGKPTTPDGPKKETYYTILDSCVKCNECIETLGCPAINAKYISSSNSSQKESEEELKYYIDEARCTPDICPGVCQRVCKNYAIRKTIINPQKEED